MIDAKTVEELRALLAKAEDAATRMAQNKSSLTDLITFRSIVNALPDLLDAAERLERQVRAKQQEIEEIAARAQENYERALALDRLAARARCRRAERGEDA